MNPILTGQPTLGLNTEMTTDQKEVLKPTLHPEIVWGDITHHPCNTTMPRYKDAHLTLVTGVLLVLAITMTGAYILLYSYENFPFKVSITS